MSLFLIIVFGSAGEDVEITQRIHFKEAGRSSSKIEQYHVIGNDSFFICPHSKVGGKSSITFSAWQHHAPLVKMLPQVGATIFLTKISALFVAFFETFLGFFFPDTLV